MLTLDDLVIADGQVVEIQSIATAVCVHFVDWQEEHWSLEFKGVMALKSLGVEGEDLDRIQINIEPESKEFNFPVSFSSFFSAWTGERVMQIVANACEIRRIERCDLPIYLPHSFIQNLSV
ncbi:MAG: hypothetical protein MUF49_21895 [Oculatellaceae cyanobacterium Prado106]|jgi:hypothetical protein|nr:hypothetical protein [Oculatellaceae cyanobacterium Prado106]